ncbi:hypothetical protein K8R66_00805 [bacterium]|nr:hypothetical protein [bacterium]
MRSRKKLLVLNLIMIIFGSVILVCGLLLIVINFLAEARIEREGLKENHFDLKEFSGQILPDSLSSTVVKYVEVPFKEVFQWDENSYIFYGSDYLYQKLVLRAERIVLNGDYIQIESAYKKIAMPELTWLNRLTQRQEIKDIKVENNKIFFILGKHVEYGGFIVGAFLLAIAVCLYLLLLCRLIKKKIKSRELLVKLRLS